MNFSIKALSLAGLKHGPFTILRRTTLRIKDSVITKSFNSFICSYGNTKIYNSKFSQFLDAPIKMLSQEYVDHVFKSTIADRTGEFTNCDFINCKGRAIVCTNEHGNLTIHKSRFYNCNVTRMGDMGGAIFATNVFTKLSNNEFSLCGARDRAQVIYTDTSSEFQNIEFNIINCHPKMRANRDAVVHVNGKHTIVNGNMTKCTAEMNAGIFIENHPSSKYMFISLNEISGGHALFLRTIREFCFCNVINCVCVDGLFVSDRNDIWLRSIYLENNTGGIIYRKSQYIVTLTNCVFKDYSEAPRGKNLAIRGTFSLEDSTATPNIFVQEVKMIEEDKIIFWTSRRLTAAFISGFIGFILIISLLKKCFLLCCQFKSRKHD